MEKVSSQFGVAERSSSLHLQLRSFCGAPGSTDRFRAASKRTLLDLREHIHLFVDARTIGGVAWKDCFNCFSAMYRYAASVCRVCV